jgi:RNA polymerase sigma-70 factor (ECF subfamily)
MNHSDAELYQGICRQDRQSFEFLYKSHYRKLYVLSYKYLRNEEQAEEVVNDVFMKVWNLGDRLDNKHSLSAYMSRSVANASLNIIKSNQRYDGKLDSFKHTLSESDEMEDQAGLLEERLVKLEAAIELLPPQCKKVLMMSKFESYKQQEIADALNISVKTVKNHLTLGYEKLRVLMSSSGGLLMVFLTIAYILWDLYNLGLSFR